MEVFNLKTGKEGDLKMQQQLNRGNIVNLNGEKVDEKNLTTKPGMNTVNPINKVVGMATKIDLSDVKIIKKDGTKEDYNIEKVITAINKSAARMIVEFTDKEIEDICNIVNQSIWEMRTKEVEIYKMHCIVENALEIVNPKVAKSYRNYRDYKIDFVKMLDKVYQESQKIMYIGDKENSNSDSALV